MSRSRTSIVSIKQFLKALPARQMQIRWKRKARGEYRTSALTTAIFELFALKFSFEFKRSHDSSSDSSTLWFTITFRLPSTTSVRILSPLTEWSTTSRRMIRLPRYWNSHFQSFLQLLNSGNWDRFLNAMTYNFRSYRRTQQVFHCFFQTVSDAITGTTAGSFTQL